ncbi:MAG: DNA polymerase III subunit delta [Pseudomonadota bacterium]|nr:DNA polymerase III subunit delta [Pseudomonadota bacterium]
MTKIAANRIDAFARKPDPAVRAVLVYGPDEGLVRERGKTVGEAVVGDLADPFRVDLLSSDTIADNPAILHDSMAALSMTGGQRLVRVRDADDGLTAAVAMMLEVPPPGDTLLVVEAGDLPARSKLRALFEASDIAAALPCYVEEGSGLETTIRSMVTGHGLAIDEDALEYLALALAGDRSRVRSEVDKLVLYMGDGKTVRLEDARACVTGSAETGLDTPVWAAADGDAATLDRTLESLLSEGQSPVAVLRMAQRHFDRLHLVAGLTATGTPLDTALARLKPPLFFKNKGRFSAQVRRWTPDRLSAALKTLLECEADCKRTGLPDTALCSRTLHQLARMARR